MPAIESTIENAIKKALECRKSYDFVGAAEVLNSALESCTSQQWQERLAIANGFNSIQRLDRSVEIAKDVFEAEAVGESAQSASASCLAVYYELIGDFSAAESAINDCIDRQPDAVEPQVVLARILGHLDEHERAIHLLQHVLSHYQPRSPRTLIRIFYQIAQSCDALGAFGSAFAAASEAKSIQRQVPGAKELAQKDSKSSTIF